MGNKSSEPQFNQLMNNLKSQKHAKKLSIRPQQKYKNQMIQAFQTSTLPKLLKDDIRTCIRQKIDMADIITTVSLISALIKNSFSPPAFKSTTYIPKPQSRQVKINFNGQKIKNAILQKNKKYDKVVQAAISQLLPSQQEEKKEKQRIEQKAKKIKFAERLLKKQIRKQYHPFKKLNKVFADFIGKIFITQQLTSEQMQEGLPSQFINFIKQKEKKLKNSQMSKDDDQHQQLARKLIHLWCRALNQACLKPYKKWILSYTEIAQKRYNKIVMQVLMDEIWAINENYLFQIVGSVIDKYKKNVKIPDQIISQVLITPALFQIDLPLQIKGQYFHTINDVSQFPSIVRPSDILEHLYKIKTSICHDIDEYHHLQQKPLEQQKNSNLKPVYEINSDNIIGIMNYVLFRVREKIQQIDRQCIFLRVLYGDIVYYTFEQSSYMLSTITSAMQFLDGGGFKDLIQNYLQKKNKKNAVSSKSKQISLEKSIDLIDSKSNLQQNSGINFSQMISNNGNKNQFNETISTAFKESKSNQC